MINTKTTIFLLFLSLLLFSGCGQGTFIQNVNYHTGVKGIELKFMDSAPPERVLEESIFPITFLISNEGAFSLNGSSYKGRLVVTYDKKYLSQTVKQNDVNFSLEGKSAIYPKGEDTYQYLSSFKTKNINMGSPNTKITATVYYPYKTILSDNICIDTYSVNDVRKKVCTIEDKTYDGQGAPIAITKLHFETQKQGIISRQIIYLNIENKGLGSVLHPISNKENDKIGDITKRSGNLTITATFSNENLTCSPSEFKLIGKQAVVRCYSNKGFGSNINYLTNLNVELGYVYTSSISKTITIQKLDEQIKSFSYGSCKNSWQTNISGICYDNCDVCSLGLGIPCSQTFTTTSNWSCVDKNLSNNKQINLSNKSQLIIKNSYCIQEEGYCGSGKICCSICSKVPECSSYITESQCNTDVCNLDAKCFWSANKCMDCSSEAIKCTSYKYKDDCNDNICGLESTCDWNGLSCQECGGTYRGSITDCNSYKQLDECEDNNCGLPYTCDWTGNKCWSCELSIKSCNVYTNQTACEDNECDLDPKCDWTGSRNKCVNCNLTTTKCSFYTDKEKCNDNECDLNPNCGWNGYDCQSCNNNVNCSSYLEKEACEDNKCDVSSDCYWNATASPHCLSES